MGYEAIAANRVAFLLLWSVGEQKGRVGGELEGRKASGHDDDSDGVHVGVARSSGRDGAAKAARRRC